MPDTDTSGHTDDENSLPDFEYGDTINNYSPNQGEEKEKEDNLNVYDAVDFIADDNMIDESIETSKSGKKDEDKPAKAGEDELEEEDDDHEANTDPNADVNSDNIIDETSKTSKSGKKDEDKPAKAGEDELEDEDNHEANTDPNADVKSDNIIDDEASETSKSGKKDKDKSAEAGEDEFEEEESNHEVNTDPNADVDSVTTIAGQDPISETILDGEGQKLPSSPTGNGENDGKDEDGGKSYHINIW